MSLKIRGISLNLTTIGCENSCFRSRCNFDQIVSTNMVSLLFSQKNNRSTLQTLDLIFERISLQHTYPHTIPKVKEDLPCCEKKTLENNPNVPNEKSPSNPYVFKRLPFFFSLSMLCHNGFWSTQPKQQLRSVGQRRAGCFHIRCIQPSDSPKGTKGDLNTSTFRMEPLGRSRRDTAESSGHWSFDARSKLGWRYHWRKKNGVKRNSSWADTWTT